jgi:DNA polymerase-1
MEEGGVSIVAVDTETYYNPDMVAPQSICKWINGARNNCPFGISLYYKRLDGIEIGWWTHDIKGLSPMLLDTSIAKVFHNSKYDLQMLKNIGVEVAGQIWDTMIMIQLIDEEFVCQMPPDENGEVHFKKSKKLKNLAYHFLGDDAHELEDLVKEYRHILASNQGKGLEEISYKDVEDANPDLMKDYAIADTEFTYKLYHIFQPMLMEQDLGRAYEVDMNATLAIIDVEREGYYMNREAMQQDEKKLQSILNDRSNAIYGICGYQFNINSDAELVTAFEKLGLQWKWFTEKGELCTDKNTLKEIIELYK